MPGSLSNYSSWTRDISVLAEQIPFINDSLVSMAVALYLAMYESKAVKRRNGYLTKEFCQEKKSMAL